MAKRGQPEKKLARTYLQKQPGEVVHICNPSYSGSRGRRIAVSNWPGEKCETLPKKKETKRIGAVVQLLECCLASTGS
jgi:hypothetical protein